MSRIHSLAVCSIAVLIAPISGIDPTNTVDRPETTAPVFEALYDRVHYVLQNGTIYKPPESDASVIPHDLFPLLLIESGSSEAPPEARWEWGILGTSDISSASFTLHSKSGTVTLKGRTHAQHSHFWFYRPANRPSSAWKRQGLRITFAQDGSPAIWEILEDSTGANTLYVSDRLEEAASQEFGPPLDRRRYSIETSTDQSPNTIVARTLSDGPLPMGPWVYLTGDMMDVTTLLCRCMPSQVEGELSTTNYRVNTVTNTPTEDPQRTDREASHSITELWRWPFPPDWIQTALRLPSSF